MLFRLAWAALTGHRSRTLLAMLGVAVSAAMLLDMVMLSSGMKRSFSKLLLSEGFQIRISPKGTLPFDTEASIPDASGVVRALRAVSGVATVSPVLGGQLHVVRGDRVVTATAIGNEPSVQGDYEIANGRAPSAANEIVGNDDFFAAAGVRVGDTLSGASGFDPELRTFTARRSFTVVGRARFLYTAAGQLAVSLPIQTLSAMQGDADSGRASLVMVRAADGVRVDSLLARIERALPNVTAISTETAMQQVDQRLSYFRQLALILGAVSLSVGFLLVATLVTVSVNERLGEIVILRAIGVARGRIVLQIVVEAVAIMVVGASVGLGLGLVTAHYLNSILASFPGLPAAIDFFVFAPRDAWSALGMLAGAGVLAGIYPSWRGASLPIATTLREEIVA